MKKFVPLFVVLMSLLGCAASFEEAKLAGDSYKAAPSDYCVSLDREQALFHGLAAGAGVLSASTGIPALLVDMNDGTKLGIEVVALSIATSGAVLVILADNRSAAWVRDCSGGSQ
jgi:hypothetical protein